MRICTCLRRHLQLLDLADTVFRIKDDNLSPRNIRKACHSRLACVARSRRQNDNFVFQAVLFGCSCHQMRQDRQSHILEGNGCSVEKLQIILTIQLDQGSNRRIIKLAVVGMVDTVVQLFFRKIIQKCRQNQLGYFLIRSVFELGKVQIDLRIGNGRKEPTICRQALQNRLAGCYSILFVACWLIN